MAERMRIHMWIGHWFMIDVQHLTACPDGRCHGSRLKDSVSKGVHSLISPALSILKLR